MARPPNLKGLRIISTMYRSYQAPEGFPVKRVVNKSGTTVLVFASGTGGEEVVQRLIDRWEACEAEAQAQA